MGDGRRETGVGSGKCIFSREERRFTQATRSQNLRRESGAESAVSLARSADLRKRRGRKISAASRERKVHFLSRGAQTCAGDAVAKSPPRVGSGKCIFSREERRLAQATRSQNLRRESGAESAFSLARSADLRRRRGRKISAASRERKVHFL